MYTLLLRVLLTPGNRKRTEKKGVRCASFFIPWFSPGYRVAQVPTFSCCCDSVLLRREVAHLHLVRPQHPSIHIVARKQLRPLHGAV